MQTGRLHSIETLGALDGPGLRTVFFMQGCNMKCCYCHNRDCWEPSSGSEITAEEIRRTALSYREYYGSDGGVTFSGGEPLLQAPFLLEAVSLLKKDGISTVLDTSGSVCNAETIELMQKTDLVILDIKHSSPEVYNSLCLFPGTNAFKNLYLLQQGLSAYWIRQVIVDGYTNNEDQITALGVLLKKGKRPERIELLPYHSLGRDKWVEIDGSYPLEGLSPVKPDRIETLADILQRKIQ